MKGLVPQLIKANRTLEKEVILVPQPLGQFLIQMRGSSIHHQEKRDQEELLNQKYFQLKEVIKIANQRQQSLDKS